MKKLTLLVSLLLCASTVFAVNLVTKPYTFTAGTKADPSKVNSNFDTVYSGTNAAIGEINSASGTKTSLTNRLGVSINSDGTMKAAITYGGEWVNPAFTDTYISGTQFSVSGDHTDIYLQYRRVKVTLAGSTVYGTINGSSYAGGITTVTLTSSILTSPITSIEHAIIAPTNSSLPTNYNAPTASVTPFSGITSKPTTLSGYGITDAATSAQGTLATNAQPAATAINTSNIGSQSVNYATSAGNSDTVDGQHASAFATAAQGTKADNALPTASYAPKAWVNFDGTDGSIRASAGVTSVTRNGTGDYTVNFSTPMTDTSYAVIATSAYQVSTALNNCVPNEIATPRTVNLFRLTCSCFTGGTVLQDPTHVQLLVFR